MSKEEIQKNSEHWYNKYKDAEKRIAELEKEKQGLKDYCDRYTKTILSLRQNVEDLENKIADIKANCNLAIEGRDIKIKELEKENAELKEKREQDCDSSWYEGFNCSEKERLKQLTKAKELLELFVQWNYGCCEIPDYKDIVKQAEQFIKECK